LEHTETYIALGKPQEDYLTIYDKIFKDNNTKTLKENCQLVSQYILHPQELPSYARSIYYVAKKLKTNYPIVIQQVLDRAFFDKKNNNYVVKPEDKNDPEIIAMLKKVQDGIKAQIKRIFPRSVFRMLSLSGLPYYKEATRNLPKKNSELI